MRPTEDLLGQRSGKLVVTGFAGYFPTSLGAPLTAYWSCKCDCGTEMKRVPAVSLKGKKVKSCGCLRKQKRSKMHLYWKWNYEKRRGTLCEDWLCYEIFKEFMASVGYTDRMRVKKLSRGSVLSPSNYCFR